MKTEISSAYLNPDKVTAYSTFIGDGTIQTGGGARAFKRRLDMPWTCLVNPNCQSSLSAKSSVWRERSGHGSSS